MRRISQRPKKVFTIFGDCSLTCRFPLSRQDGQVSIHILRLQQAFAAVTPSQRYLLISPCRDEAQYLRRTLESVAGQSVPPALWIVVDDGSTDDTPTILDEYASRLPYLRVVRRTDRGHRKVGPG